MKLPLTKFQETLADNLSAKDMTRASAIVYISKLRLLNKNENFNNLNFLLSKDVIDARLSDIANINTRRSYQTAIVNSIRVLPKLPKKVRDLADQYRADLDNTISEINAVPRSQKSAKQIENWMTQDEINKVYERYRKRVFNLEFEIKPNKQDRVDITRFTVLSLYTRIPPRRSQDYRMMVLGEANPKDLTLNYMDMSKKLLTFNVYKTSGAYGQQSVNMSPELVADMKKVIELRSLKEGEHILVNSVGKPLTSSEQLTSILNNAFDKKVSTSMLRNIFLSSEFGKNLELYKQMNSVAKSMGNSLASQQGYIKKES